MEEKYMMLRGSSGDHLRIIAGPSEEEWVEETGENFTEKEKKVDTY
jgi:hypothetical protein